MDSQVDPEALWLDLSIAPEELIRMDPLDITAETLEQAEQPETCDFSLASLPPRRFSVRQEDAERKERQKALRPITEEWLGGIGPGPT